MTIVLTVFLINMNQQKCNNEAPPPKLTITVKADHTETYKWEIPTLENSYKFPWDCVQPDGGG